jgi:hypothetical protein
MTHNPWIRTLILALVALSFTATASGQSWLYATLEPYGVSGQSLLAEAPLTPSGPGAVQRWLTLPGPAIAGPVVSFDGRYVVFTFGRAGATGDRLAFFDRRTGDVRTYAATSVSGQLLLPDPNLLRFFLFGNGSATVISIEPLQLQTFAMPDFLPVAAFSADGRELFVGRGAATAPTLRISVYAPYTGVEKRSLSLDAPPTAMTVSRDGARLFVTTAAPALKVLDAVTGTELATRGPLTATPGFAARYSGIVLEDARNRLFVNYDDPTDLRRNTTRLYVLDALSLAVITDQPFDNNVVVDRTQNIAVRLATTRDPYVHCSPMVIEVWGESAVPASSSISSGLCPAIAVATPPDAPQPFSVTVNGQRVTLNWSAVTGATDYVIEAGLSSGGSNLARIETNGVTTLVVDNVPAGTYYVRVRAINAVGAGAASDEVVVVVP